MRDAAGVNTLMDMANKKIGVIAGTSNERALSEAMKAKVITATVVPLKSREDGLAQLEAGTIDGFASDRVLLAGLASKAKNPKALALLVDALSYEPYAIVLPRGDWAMHQAVNSALRRSTPAARCPRSTAAGSAAWAARARCSRSCTRSVACPNRGRGGGSRGREAPIQ